MKVTETISVVGSSDYIKTEDFCLYAAKNPFWADCKSNHIICDIQGKNAVAVNLVDADDPKYFHSKIFKQLVRLIDEKVRDGESVTIICNKGQSRSASIAMLYLAAIGEITNESYKKSSEEFIKLYKDFKPSRGISKFLEATWHFYFNRYNNK